MASGGLGRRVSAAVGRARARWRWLDRAVRTQQLFTLRNGSLQAGGVTYFAFLSFFPVLALAFFVVGYVARVWPGAEDSLASGIEQVLPGLVGTGSGQLSLTTIRDNAGTAGVVGLVGVLYAGLGWLSALRSALRAIFEQPGGDRPGFVVGKLRDLATLAVIGTILLAGVAVSGVATGYSEQALGWLGVESGSAWVLFVLSAALGVATSTVMFFAMFTLLARPPVPRRALWGGAVLGGAAYEALKWASTYLLQTARHQQAAQVFGVALVLVVWMYYFSRLVLYAAAWAGTAPRRAEPEDPAPDEQGLVEHGTDLAVDPPAPVRGRVVGVFLGGAGLGALLAYVAGRRPRDR